MNKEEEACRQEKLKSIDAYKASLATPDQERELGEIVKNFNSHGVRIRSLFDLISREHFVSDKALEVALAWLMKAKHISNKWELFHFVAESKVKHQCSQQVITIAMDQYKNTNPLDHGVRNFAANIIFALATDKYHDAILALASNDSNQDLDEGGLWDVSERPFIIEALGKMKKHPEVVDELIKLLKDERGYAYTGAIRALGRLKNPKALPYLEQFVNDKDSWIRKYAKSAVSKIEKAQAKAKKE